MAASLLLGRATSRLLKGALKTCASTLTCSSKRQLLSQAYSCTEAWKKRLEDPVFSEIPLSDFAIKLRDQYDQQKILSAVDMEILANKLHEMEIDEAEFVEDLMIKFRKCPDSKPVRDSIVYAIIRSYIDGNMADRLLSLMQARSETGIFPDAVASSLLLDHFIEDKDFRSAAHVAYELMLQEDFSHPASRLLSLYATVMHLESVALDDIAPEEIVLAEVDEDSKDKDKVKMVAVKYIRYPSYDDHFDIKCQQYLLGKTLHHLGRTVGQTMLGTSLQVVGLALHHKFKPCFQLLTNIANSSDSSLVQDCLSYVGESLEKVQTRDPDKPERGTGWLTVDDEIYKLLPTQEEKESYQVQLQELGQRLQAQGKVTQDKLSTLVEAFVTSQLAQHETVDIEVQTKRLDKWRQDRQTLLQEQLYQLERQQKTQEIEAKLKELQDKEEMIRFFELYDKIRLIQPKKLPKEPVSQEEEDEDVLRAKRIKRRKYRHKV